MPLRTKPIRSALGALAALMLLGGCYTPHAAGGYGVAYEPAYGGPELYDDYVPAPPPSYGVAPVYAEPYPVYPGGTASVSVSIYDYDGPDGRPIRRHRPYDYGYSHPRKDRGHRVFHDDRGPKDRVVHRDRRGPKDRVRHRDPGPKGPTGGTAYRRGFVEGLRTGRDRSDEPARLKDRKPRQGFGADGRRIARDLGWRPKEERGRPARGDRHADAGKRRDRRGEGAGGRGRGDRVVRGDRGNRVRGDQGAFRSDRGRPRTGGRGQDRVARGPARPTKPRGGQVEGPRRKTRHDPWNAHTGYNRQDPVTGQAPLHQFSER
ncbi:MAG: hypothetical protein AAGC57_03640 [Pseudomonadota bacterium]